MGKHISKRADSVQSWKVEQKKIWIGAGQGPSLRGHMLRCPASTLYPAVRAGKLRMEGLSFFLAPAFCSFFFVPPPKSKEGEKKITIESSFALWTDSINRCSVPPTSRRTSVHGGNESQRFH